MRSPIEEVSRSIRPSRLRRSIPNHVIERIRQRTAGTDLITMENADLRIVLDDVVESGILAGKARPLHDTVLKEDFLLVDIGEKFPEAGAIVCKDRTGSRPQAIVTIVEMKWLKGKLATGRWLPSAAPQDAEAVRTLDTMKRSPPLTHKPFAELPAILPALSPAPAPEPEPQQVPGDRGPNGGSAYIYELALALLKRGEAVGVPTLRAAERHLYAAATVKRGVDKAVAALQAQGWKVELDAVAKAELGCRGPAKIYRARPHLGESLLAVGASGAVDLQAIALPPPPKQGKTAPARIKVASPAAADPQPQRRPVLEEVRIKVTTRIGELEAQLKPLRDCIRDLETRVQPVQEELTNLQQLLPVISAPAPTPLPEAIAA
jgi:hypothetical protein